MTPFSKIVLTDRFEEATDALKAIWEGAQFHVIEADDFLVEHAVEAMEKAYLHGDRTKVIVLRAKRFTPIAQNKLLKILEEPPSGTVFVLMTPSKSGLLPTVRSRLPVEKAQQADKDPAEAEMILPVDLASLYRFLTEHRRISGADARRIVERLGVEALRGGRVKVDDKLLETFDQSVKLLDMGSPPSFVLARLGLKLVEKCR